MNEEEYKRTPEDFEAYANREIFVVWHNDYDEQWPVLAFDRNEDAQSFIDQSDDDKLCTYRVDLFVDNMVDFASL